MITRRKMHYDQQVISPDRFSEPLNDKRIRFTATIDIEYNERDLKDYDLISPLLSALHNIMNTSVDDSKGPTWEDIVALGKNNNTVEVLAINPLKRTTEEVLLRMVIALDKDVRGLQQALNRAG